MNKVKTGVLLGALDNSTFKDGRKLLRWAEKIAKEGKYNSFEIFINDISEMCEAYRSICRASQMETIFIPGVPLKLLGLDLSSTDEAVRSVAEKEVIDGIRSAFELNAGVSTIICGGPYNGDEDEKRYHNLIKSLKNIFAARDKLSEQYNTTMEIEAEPFSVNRDPFFFWGQTDMTKRIISELEAEGHHLRICFDMAHFCLLEENLLESFQILMPYIYHIHLSNCVMDDPTNKLYGDKHPMFGVKGSRIGEKELVDFLTGIKELGFFDDNKDITISYEVITGQGQDPLYVYEEENKIFFHVLKETGLY